jgi:oligogalacturonide transport system permease protein
MALHQNRFKNYHGYLYIAPWLIGFFLLTLIPFVASLVYSFTNYDMFNFKFVGLSNYIDIFTHNQIFRDSLGRTLWYTLIAVPGKLVVALMLALLLNKKIKGIGVYRTLFYLPSILGASVALSVLWKYVFKTDGLANMFLGLLHIPGINWLGDPDQALFCLILLPLWQMGAPMVLFLAALKTVPPEVTEAATIDGAGKVRTFFHVTLPLITPVIFFNLIMQTIEIIQLFTPAYIITQGGPIKSTYLYALMLYDVSFRDFKMGYASALSWVLFVIIIVYTVILFRTSRKWVFYEDQGA